MTVQEMLDELEKVEDKTRPIWFYRNGVVLEVVKDLDSRDTVGTLKWGIESDDMSNEVLIHLTSD